MATLGLSTEWYHVCIDTNFGVHGILTYNQRLFQNLCDSQASKSLISCCVQDMWWSDRWPDFQGSDGELEAGGSYNYPQPYI